MVESAEPCASPRVAYLARNPAFRAELAFRSRSTAAASVIAGRPVATSQQRSITWTRVQFTALFLTRDCGVSSSHCKATP